MLTRDARAAAPVASVPASSVGGATHPDTSLDRLRLRVAAGLPPDLATLPARSRRAVSVAVAVGAPLLDAIDGAQSAEDDAAQARRAVAVASAQTRTVAGGLLLAPVLLVPALSRLVGADLVGFYASGLGLMVLAAGATLLLVGALLVVGLIRRVGRAAVPPTTGRRIAAGVAVVVGLLTWRVAGPLVAPIAVVLAHHLAERRLPAPPVTGVDEAADLAATAIAGGVSASEALRVAADELPELAHRLRRLAFGLELGMPVDELATASSRRSPTDGLLRLVVVLTTAEEVGAPLGPTLRRLARDLRADELARVLAAAERLPAHLTFPTALFLLPGTVLLVGAPIVHAGLVAAGT